MTTADGRSGSTVGKYRLHEVVGRGGMGVVYRAEHVYIGREVAVKILHEGYGGREESIKRFLREARAASLINHPNIVDVTDFGKANDGTVFFVMELLVGQPLDVILARERRLELLRSIIICNQLAAALAAAHSKDIIHRDLKPENVMLIPREGRRELVRRVSDESGAYELSEREKEFDFVKILDFGVAKVREPEARKGAVTRAGVVFGTPEYMAPETARIGFSDARSDIYALGIMFYEMMTGTVPFVGDTPVEIMMKQVNERVPPMRRVAPDAEITEDAERMILKALAKDPVQRHQSMEEFHRDLQKCYGQLRFRRTLRTPTVIHTTTQGDGHAHTPPAAAIPLTKKKKPAVAGAIPTAMGLGVGSSSGEIDTSAPRPRLATPRLPGLPVNATAPILLTKKKPQRPEGVTRAEPVPTSLPAPAIERASIGFDPVARPGPQESPAEFAFAASAALLSTGLTDDTPMSPDAITREMPKEYFEGAAAYARHAALHRAEDAAPRAEISGDDDAERTLPGARKRKTLPLGFDQEADRVTPVQNMATVAAALATGGADDIPPVDAPEAPRSLADADADARPESDPGDGGDGISGAGVDIGVVMIALPGGLRSAPALPATPVPSATDDRATPRVTAAASAAGDDVNERSWPDEPTAPAVADFSGKADKTG